MGIFTNTTELVTLSANMMKILAVGYIAMAVTQSLSGVMRGAGDTMTPMWISMVVTVVIRVPLAYGLAFLTRTPELPNGRYQVLWISMLVSWCMGALLTLIFYKKEIGKESTDRKLIRKIKENKRKMQEGFVKKKSFLRFFFS